MTQDVTDLFTQVHEEHAISAPSWFTTSTEDPTEMGSCTCGEVLTGNVVEAMTRHRADEFHKLAYQAGWRQPFSEEDLRRGPTTLRATIRRHFATVDEASAWVETVLDLPGDEGDTDAEIGPVEGDQIEAGARALYELDRPLGGPGWDELLPDGPVQERERVRVGVVLSAVRAPSTLKANDNEGTSA